MTNEPEHYEPTPRAARAIAAAWIAAGLCVLAARRIHTHRRRVATALAFAATAFAGWHARGVGPVTVGAVSVAASAGELTGDAGELAPTADPLAALQDGYATPPADVRPVAPAEPGGAVLPTTDGMFGPLDSGAPPSWLSRELAPYWGSIAAAAHEVGIDSHWLGIVAMVENPQAQTAIVTFDGGHGLAQIQRETAMMIEAESGLPCVNGWADPATSYRCGAHYFRGAVRDGADLARPGDAEPALLMGVAGYNSGHGSAIVGTLRRALASGAGDPCAAIGNQYTRRYCYTARDMWAGSMAERGTAPGEPGSGPALPHLEAMRP